MPELDEGVGNLERFIGLLTDTSAKVQDAVGDIDQEASGLDTLDSTAEDVLGDFNSAIADMADDIGEAADEAAARIDATGQAARTIAQDRCGEAESDAEGAGQAFTDKVSSGGDELETEAATVAGNGFKSVSDTLDRVTQETHDAADAAGQALDQLTTAAGTQQQAAETAFEAAESQYEAAAVEIGDMETSVASQSNDTVSELEGAGEELENAATSVQGENDATYSGAGDRVNEITDDLDDGTTTALEAVADALDTSASSPITDAGALADQSSSSYDSALDEVKAVLDSAVALSEVVEPLVPELQKSLGVVDTIDEMLKAME